MSSRCSGSRWEFGGEQHHIKRGRAPSNPLLESPLIKCFYSISLFLPSCIFCISWPGFFVWKWFVYAFLSLLLSFSPSPLLPCPWRPAQSCCTGTGTLRMWVGCPPPPLNKRAHSLFSLLKTTRFQNSLKSVSLFPRLSEFWILLLRKRVHADNRDHEKLKSQSGGELVRDRGAFVKRGGAYGKKEEKMFFWMRP